MKVIIKDEDTNRILWTGEDCATHIGVVAQTWRSYSAAGRTPEKATTILGNVPLWYADEVKHWHANRPGSPVPNNAKDRR